ncbi:hypothetical protein QFZ79_001013 [Arthrobacter sp. V4I6]|nr:hypothetical protein [Arthrobacter sp. V1I7]MDQ0852902.1 hypothetical protein [Arthrobacter sp. V4I6]
MTPPAPGWNNIPTTGAYSMAIAYTGGSVMLAAALLAVLVLMVPADVSARRTAKTDSEAPAVLTRTK